MKHKLSKVWISRILQARVSQGSGNTMPDKSDLDPISFRTSWKCLFTCPGTSHNKFTMLYFTFDNCYELPCCVENIGYSDQLASSETNWSGSTLFLIF